MKTATLKASVPFYSKKIDLGPSDSSSFDFNKTQFEYKGLRTEQPDQMELEISWALNEHHTTDQLDRYIEKGIEALNHVIYFARTFDDDSTKMVLLSPRTIRSVKLVIEDSGNVICDVDYELTYTPPKYFEEYYDYINDESWHTNFNEVIEMAGNQVLEINLLVGSNHAIYEGRYSEAVINCLTAIETHIFPVLLEWLQNSFLNKSEKNAENLLIDMTSSAKLELIFGTIKAVYLKHHPKLLEDLKGINRLRNNIVHKGIRATKAEAINALNTTAKFIMILYFQIGEHDYNWND